MPEMMRTLRVSRSTDRDGKEPSCRNVSSMSRAETHLFCQRSEPPRWKPHHYQRYSRNV